MISSRIITYLTNLRCIGIPGPALSAAAVCYSSAAVCENHLLMGRRDSSTRRGKIFKGSFGKARPGKKVETNPYKLPKAPETIPIPYPPRPTQPALPSAAAAGDSLLV